MEKDLQAQSKEWFDLKKLTPDKMALAKLALAEIREGKEVFEAIRRHPLKTAGGGVYRETDVGGGVSENGGKWGDGSGSEPVGENTDETNAYPVWGDGSDGIDQALSLPGEVHLLPNRYQDAEKLSTRRTRGDAGTTPPI